MHIFRPLQKHLQSFQKYPDKIVGGVEFTRFSDGRSDRCIGKTKMSPNPDGVGEGGDIITNILLTN